MSLAHVQPSKYIRLFPLFPSSLFVWGRRNYALRVCVFDIAQRLKRIEG